MPPDKRLGNVRIEDKINFRCKKEEARFVIPREFGLTSNSVGKDGRKNPGRLRSDTLMSLLAAEGSDAWSVDNDDLSS